MTMNKKHLTPDQEDMINQVAATMAISNMPLTEEAYADLLAIASGEKTVEQAVEKMKRRYSRINKK